MLLHPSYSYAVIGLWVNETPVILVLYSLPIYNRSSVCIKYLCGLRGGEDERSSPSVSHCLQLVLVVAIFIIISRNSIAPGLDKEIQIYLLLLNIRNLCDNIVCYVSNPVGKHRVAV